MKREKTESTMDTRESLLKTIEENLSDMFVEKYEQVNAARVSVNAYLKDIEIGYQYDYNNFCIDFMFNTKNLVNNIDIEQLRELDTNMFVSEVMSFMIKNKIYENISDLDKRTYLMIQHELKKFLINR
jgi:hypothetical protein